ncbi:hypothetical protein [uncultured Dysgonomonas sp.]|uniref:hypothetical protein n=1 Tax=uncultured Dysgonomonas sp. TaxID=206096 RepID=UPI002629BB3E|nr:hypothetical protein [uncultured Dysgonomonas sp.]
MIISLSQSGNSGHNNSNRNAEGFPADKENKEQRLVNKKNEEQGNGRNYDTRRSAAGSSITAK